MAADDYVLNAVRVHQRDKLFQIALNLQHTENETYGTREVSRVIAAARTRIGILI